LTNIGPVILEFQKSIDEYLNAGLIWKIQTDTYQREIDRYGANTMELSEQIFHFDSCFVVNVLDKIHGDEGEDIRWLIAIQAVDSLLDDFKFTLNRKKGLMENLKIEFAHEFHMDKNLKLQVDKKFRKHRSSVESILSAKTESENDLKPLFDLLEEKS